MRDPIPNEDDFIRDHLDLDKSDGWELISASSVMREEFQYSGAKFEIVQSYLHAIDLLAAEPKNYGKYKLISMRTVWVPLLFLCRHVMELSLKNALELTNVKVEKPTHNIASLWKKFVESNRPHITKEDRPIIDRIAVLVKVLSKLDPDGEHFRYSTSNKNELFRDKPYLINPKRFSDEVHSAVLALNNIDAT